MLSLQTVYPDTLELLKRLSSLPVLRAMRLVGGTALALQYGHRRSVDLDFFGETTSGVDELTEELKASVGELSLLSASKTIRVYSIQGIKVDVVNYSYGWIDDAVTSDGIILASPKDIAAMKVSAIIGRGTKKDFIDIYYLLQHFSFDQLIQFYLQKYPDGSEYRALLSMTYFGDADPQPMPYMFTSMTWETMKEMICQEVEKYNQQQM